MSSRLYTVGVYAGMFSRSYPFVVHHCLLLYILIIYILCYFDCVSFIVSVFFITCHMLYLCTDTQEHGIKLVPAIVLLSPGLGSFQMQVSMEIQMRQVLVMQGGDIDRVIQT